VIENGEVTLHGMIMSIHPDCFRIEHAGAFTGIGKSYYPGSSSNPCKEGASKEALKIKRQIGLPVPQQARPGYRTKPPRGTPKFLAREKNRVRNPGMLLHKRSPRRMNQPANLSLWPMAMQSRDYWQCMNDITEGTRFDDQNAL
jgi:hypothetical protein